MLGDTPTEERARFIRKLFAGPWSTDDVKAHEGYALDRWHWLLDLKKAPTPLPSIGRKCEILAWTLYRCFVLLQDQQARQSVAV